MNKKRILWSLLLSLVFIFALGVSANAAEALKAPTVTATGVSAEVTLAWTPVQEAASYTVKRAATPGGPYTDVASKLTATNYIDKGLTNGTTYYYVVSAVNTGGEATSSEVSATPQPSGNGYLIITVSGTMRQYPMSMAQVQAFLDWYGNRTTGGNIYKIEMPVAPPYKKITDYLIFDKIVTWQIREY